MKKILYLLSIGLMIMLLGCGSTAATKTSTSKTLKMADFIQAYTDAGVKVDTNEKQEFSVISATDGVIFYMNSNPVKIYEYASKKELDKAEKDFDLMKDWPVSGLFVLETNEDKAKEIFKSVK